MSLRPEIPAELGDRIIDFLSDSQSALRACSLVCKRSLLCSRHYLFSRVTVQPTLEFLQFLRSSTLVAEHAQTLDFRLWPPQTDTVTTGILHCLANASHVQAMIFGHLPPPPLIYPQTAVKLAFHHSAFKSRTEFSLFLSSFPAVRDLELMRVTWDDAGDKIYPEVKLDLESLSIQGLQETSDIWPWLSCPQFSPRTRVLTVSLPTQGDPVALTVLSNFLRHLNGQLQELQLEVYPSGHLPPLLKLDNLTSLRRLKIGRGLYFSVPTVAAAPPMCRTFPHVLDIALRLASRNQLEELLFDVEIGPPLWLSKADCDSRLTSVLAASCVRQIPSVGFHLVGDRDTTRQVGNLHHRQLVAAFLRERGWVSRGRTVVSFDNFKYICGRLR
ncbi:hypothetical protein C8R47DRAFT_1196938 [Mycena vitilis]|nr:hypothetical protein C8R47DRAFT_1196938 [Mycena vitilis]